MAPAAHSHAASALLSHIHQSVCLHNTKSSAPNFRGGPGCIKMLMQFPGLNGTLFEGALFDRITDRYSRVPRLSSRVRVIDSKIYFLILCGAHLDKPNEIQTTLSKTEHTKNVNAKHSAKRKLFATHAYCAFLEKRIRIPILSTNRPDNTTGHDV